MLVPGSAGGAKEYDADRALTYVRQAAAGAVEAHAHITQQDVEDFLFSDWCDADFSTEAGLMRALGRFEARVDADRLLPTETGGTEEFFFPVQDWDLHRYSDWFLLACVALRWAVEQYDAALIPAA